VQLAKHHLRAGIASHCRPHDVRELAEHFRAELGAIGPSAVLAAEIRSAIVLAAVAVVRTAIILPAIIVSTIIVASIAPVPPIIVPTIIRAPSSIIPSAVIARVGLLRVLLKPLQAPENHVQFLLESAFGFVPRHGRSGEGRN